MLIQRTAMARAPKVEMVAFILFRSLDSLKPAVKSLSAVGLQQECGYY